jgi:EAL domain-containing protein (putative c-di-GMP-specific phosphodiesterase class I)
LGGDEFGILAVNRTVDEAEEMGRKLCRLIDDHIFIWHQRRFKIGVSIGIAPVSESSGRVVDLLKAADRACYAAKDKGRNRVHVYHEHDPELKKRRREMEWVNRIHRAFAEDLFRLYFQPIIPINGKDTGVHFEILLRLEDSQGNGGGNVIGPDVFLPAAEHYQITGKIDRWVVNTVFRRLMADPRQLEHLHLCAINLSGSSLEDETFLNSIIKAFDDIPVPPEKICFEITETAAITNFAATIRFIETLRERGCRFSLDDFGTGMSCFKYLMNFPVDYLKIDGSFILDLADNPVSRAIVKSMIEVGHIMNKKIIAEFVENETTLEILREMGVDYCQGFMMGLPQPVWWEHAA